MVQNTIKELIFSRSHEGCDAPQELIEAQTEMQNIKRLFVKTCVLLPVTALLGACKAIAMGQRPQLSPAQKRMDGIGLTRTLMRNIFTVCLMSLLTLLQGCAYATDNVGMTLLFTNKGPYSIGVLRFDPDGQRGPTPGSLGVGGNAQMAFMAGDSKRGVPQFVELEWMVATPEVKNLRTKRDQAFSDYSKPWMDETDRINTIAPHYTRRIDLTDLLTPELLAQVRTNRSNTHLKLTVVFKDDSVNITAEPEIWRK